MCHGYVIGQRRRGGVFHFLILSLLVLSSRYYAIASTTEPYSTDSNGTYLMVSPQTPMVHMANLTANEQEEPSKVVPNGSILPIVPPISFFGALTCQPYQGEHPNHIYFQLANAFFLLSHLAPSGVHGVLYLRLTFLVGCAFLALWSWMVVCWFDALLWNVLFICINAVHVCTLFYKLRPVRFSKEIEEVYAAVFRPLRVTRHQFKKVLSCMKVIRHLKYQELYTQERATRVDSLSLVLSGKLVVSQNGKALHIVHRHQFLDSSEWFGVSTDEYFQVSITAMEESRVLVWHRDKLKLSIITDQFLLTVFDHILGRDVVKKLIQVSETMVASAYQQQNGHVPGIGTNNLDPDLDAKMFVVKKGGDNRITALISRQLQEERVPLLFSNTEVLNNALHRYEYPKTHPDSRM